MGPLFRGDLAQRRAGEGRANHVGQRARPFSRAPGTPFCALGVVHLVRSRWQNGSVMNHAFISYIREDRQRVDALATALRAYGIEVWLDREALNPGVRWSDSIRKAIREGAFFVACFSRAYYDRAHTFMDEEVAIAIDELDASFTPERQPWRLE
jgi:TIR domain